MSGSERQREIRRRRHRKKKLGLWKNRIEKASPSEKVAIASKLRDLTPGAESIIATHALEDR
jgi:hypothetical protein